MMSLVNLILIVVVVAGNAMTELDFKMINDITSSCCVVLAFLAFKFVSKGKRLN